MLRYDSQIQKRIKLNRAILERLTKFWETKTWKKKKKVQTVQFSPNQLLPTLFTLRNEETKIIAVMSSNLDDLLYGHLPEGALAMNSVLQQFLVGKEQHGTFRFCGENSDKMRTLVFMSRLKTTLSEHNQSLSTRNMACHEGY